MSAWLWGLPLIITLLALLLVSWADYSLRDFSRSRLEELCRSDTRKGRFASILKNYDRVGFALELWQHILSVVMVVVMLMWVSFPAANSTTPSAPVTINTDPVSLITHALMAVGMLLVFGISIPWSLARIRGEELLALTWPVWSFLAAVLSPIAWIVSRADRVWHRLNDVPLPEESETSSITQELRSVTEEGHREGELEAEARTMIHRVIDFYDVDVADIMTPRTEMVSISADSSLQDARQTLLEEGHSRVPVVGKTTDDIVGLLYAKDLLRYIDGSMGTEVRLADIAREPFYVPKTMSIDQLLKAFKKERMHIAIVLDEYGGVAGLVTMEDILEEIVGEIADEFDSAIEADPIRQVSENVYDIYAKQHLDDVNERLSIELPADGGIDTLGGFVFSQMGHIPLVGEQFTWENVLITILEAHKRRIVRLRLQIDRSNTAWESGVQKS